MPNKKKSVMFLLVVSLFLATSISFIFYESRNFNNQENTGKVTLLEPEKSNQNFFLNYLEEDKDDFVKTYFSSKKSISSSEKRLIIEEKTEASKVSSANDAKQTYSSGEIFEQNGEQYIMRGDEAYVTIGIFFSPSLPSSVCAGDKGNEYMDITVTGKVLIDINYRVACAMIGGDVYNLKIKIMESDTASSDDLIDEDVFYTNKQCTDTDDFYIPFSVTFKDVNLGANFGGAEDSGTIEVYATVEPLDKKTIKASTKNFDVNKITNCVCLSGACCDMASRPYKFKSSGSQPTKQEDEYFCSGTNSPTATSYVKVRDYYCDGKSSSVKYTESTENTCGLCAYCQDNYDSCFFYYQKEKCGTTDCDSLDTSCRDYQDIDKVCTGGGKCESPTGCNSYTDKSRHTSCGAGKECDGNGNCATCISQSSSSCYDNDIYWFDNCLNRGEKKTECEENTCDANQYSYYRYCDGNAVMEEKSCRERGCSSSDCYNNKRATVGRITTCSSGCENGACKSPTIVCAKNSDCGTDSWTGSTFCSSNNVAQKWKTYTCSNPGTTSSSCSSAETDKQKESCASGCTNGACQSQLTCQKSSDCGGGSDAGVWDREPFCSNGDIVRRWKFRGCVNRVCSNIIEIKTIEDCGNKECKDATCQIPTPVEDYPDLVVNDLVIQSIVGKSVVLGFTIENVGEGTADFVYWMVDVGSNDENPKRTNPISLAPGVSTRAFMLFNYSQSGTYNPMIIVDFENIVEETNENNNERAISVSV